MNSENKELYATIAFYCQALSGLSGLILSGLIRRRVLMIVLHLILMILGLVGIWGVKKQVAKAIYVQAFFTTALSMTLLIYEILSKIIINQFNSETLFLIPFLVDSISGIIGFAYYYKINPGRDSGEQGLNLSIPFVNSADARLENCEYRAEASSSHFSIRQNADIPTSLCSICQNLNAHFAILPCGHKCLCNQCKHQYTRNTNFCPICRRSVTSVIQIFD